MYDEEHYTRGLTAGGLEKQGFGHGYCETKSAALKIFFKTDFIRSAGHKFIFHVIHKFFHEENAQPAPAMLGKMFL